MGKTKENIAKLGRFSEEQVLMHLHEKSLIDEAIRNRFSARAEELVQRIRDDSDPTMMELFLGEYGLSSEEGVALMCLAEALLRVPDSETMDALIEDKIASSQWDKHLGQSHSSLINASTWALFMTGKVLNEHHELPVVSVLHSAIKRLGEPVIRQAVGRVMKELGQQFVLGETINLAMKRAKDKQSEGFTYSYDMLGEAACTDADARRFHLSYTEAISQIARQADSVDIRENPGISVKLSALHARYETLQAERVMSELLPRIRSLAVLAKSAGIGLNIDAEEAGRLELSLDIIEALIADPALENWDGFGIVVQAYGLRASAVIDWLYELAQTHNRKIMVRLVKGAYWDTEIKHAQVEGLEGYPVFTKKASTDVSYICCAKKLLGMTDRIYPQFATHNAHSVAAVLEMAENKDSFEFQRLHGMGEALHDTVLRRQKTRCRIYAPVGAHKDLLAYLVRRLLENGANSSFVNQIVDQTIPPSEVAADPFAHLFDSSSTIANDRIAKPAMLFAPSRINSRGWDLENPEVLDQLKSGLNRFLASEWSDGSKTGSDLVEITNPSNGELVGKINYASEADVAASIERLSVWTDASASQRADVLRKTAELYEENHDEIFALLMREAGKTIADCVGELREAVDFLRYYASEVETSKIEPAGIFACISPWNFPLAIFTGQIAAALAAGNAVIAKPAESTPLIAQYAVDLMHRVGVPESVLALVHGPGAKVGSAMVSNPHISGVCFTGSTTTAQHINRSMAENLAPHAPLIAETGGLNAMIVDSTALPEQAVMDIVASAFQSAGQRCSALRVLYLQEDIAEPFLKMLCGAMDELKLGDPTNLDTDIGPVIDSSAKARIDQHIQIATEQGRLIKQLKTPVIGTFVGPAIIKVGGIEDLAAEVFGPVLHVATYAQEDFGNVIDQINASGFGLTFGMHSRIDHRVQYAVEHVNVGNIYINRNQIGAVVGSQPFGGEGLSGTGPKAGGPKYLNRFAKVTPIEDAHISGNSIDAKAINDRFTALESEHRKGQQKSCFEPTELPGPTGESNLYQLAPRGRVLCLGPTPEQAAAQAEAAVKLGCVALAIAPDAIDGIDASIEPETLIAVEELDAVICWSDQASSIRKALAKRDGPIVPVFTDQDFAQWLTVERHTCINTTAAGGNASLLSEQE